MAVCGGGGGKHLYNHWRNCQQNPRISVAIHLKIVYPVNWRGNKILLIVQFLKLQYKEISSKILITWKMS